MKKFFLFAILGAVISGCVSSGTYDQAVMERDNARGSADSLNRIVTGLNKTMLDKQLQINRLEEELKAQKDLYEQLKKNTSAGNLDMIERLEKLRNDIAEREARIKDIKQKLEEREAFLNALRDRIQKAMSGVEADGISVHIQDGRLYVTLANQLLFKSGQTDIDPKGQDALLQLANVLNREEDINVLVEGHTDNQSVRPGQRFSDNWDLSVLRATEVVRYLTNKGNVDPKRVIASGRSEYFPVEPGDSQEARAKNRRTEIILTPKLDLLMELVK